MTSVHPRTLRLYRTTGELLWNALLQKPELVHPSSVPLPSATTSESFSPFCVVDVGGARTKALMLDHMKQTHGGKVTEWTPTSFQANMAAPTDRASTANWCLSPSSLRYKLQSAPLKLAMASVAEIRPDISWKKDWQQQTMFIPDEEGLPSPYLVWVAVDHLHGLARVYYNEDILDPPQFRDALKRHDPPTLHAKVGAKERASLRPPLAMSGREGSLDHALTCLGLGQVRLPQRKPETAQFGNGANHQSRASFPY